jgi:hypothetical protein
MPFVFSTGYDKDRMLEGYRTCPVLQKPYHRSEKPYHPVGIERHARETVYSKGADRRTGNSGRYENAALKFASTRLLEQIPCAVGQHL